jgi:hypothetical protein
MYFPILRGKQFELIALRDISNILNAKKTIVSPIIEPVKESSSVLKKTLEVLKANEINFNILVNPIVGDLRNNESLILHLLKSTLQGYSNFQICFYINKEDSVNHCFNIASQIDFDFKGFTFIHNIALEDLSDLKKFDNIKPTLYNLVNFSKTNRRYNRNFPKDSLVLLDDYFNAASKNSDYIHNTDEPFTEEHLYYKQDGFIGFSDYLTIGDNFSEGGFLPYAVVIHLTYTDVNKKLRIRHFVSDSNQDSTDIGGKFSEALGKLIRWLSENSLNTKAVQEFKDLYLKGHFPGLGSVKKLSIMHHIELLLNIIE